MTRPAEGESDNGDAFFIAALDKQRAVRELVVSHPATPQSDHAVKALDLYESDIGLIAVIDGVGHGPEAAAITEATLECLRVNCHLDLVPLVELCHHNVLHTRGATISIAKLQIAESTLQYLGVGNVQGQLGTEQVKRNTKEPRPIYNTGGYPSMLKQTLLVNNNGTIGYRVPKKINAFTYPFSMGDVLIMTSDGISLDVYSAVSEQILDPESLAQTILAKYSLAQDDATIIVVR